MAQRLAQEIPEQLTGIGVIAAGVPVNSACRDSAVPVSAAFMWGTDDPIAPFDGGQMAGDRGAILSAQQSIDVWVNRNGTDRSATSTNFPDIDKNDESAVQRLLYDGGVNGTKVALYRVDGGGHTEPSIAAQYRRLFERVVGQQNHDVEMADELWSFFSELDPS